MLDNPSKLELEWEPIMSNINSHNYKVLDLDNKDKSYHNKISLNLEFKFKYIVSNNINFNNKPIIGNNLKAA